MQVLIVGLAKSKSDRGERAYNVVAADRDSPSVAPRDSDRLAYDPMLAEALARNSQPLGNRLAGAQHPDRERKRVGPHVPAQRFVELLEFTRDLLVHFD